MIFLFAITLMSFGVLTGWAGQLSLGQMAFSGVGAATSAWLTQRWNWDITLATLVAGSVGAVVSLVVGVPALRLRGAYLAVTTLRVRDHGQRLLPQPPLLRLAADRADRTETRSSVSSTGRPSRAIYYISLIAMLLAFVAVRGIRNSRTGRVLIALRDNEAAVESYGVEPGSRQADRVRHLGVPRRVRRLALWCTTSRRSSSTIARFNLLVFSGAVIGGLGSPLGAFLGSLYFNGTFFWLQGSWRLLASGVGLLGILLVAPGGLTGLWYDLRDLTLRWFGARRGIVEGDRAEDLLDDEPTRPTISATCPTRGAGHRHRCHADTRPPRPRRSKRRPHDRHARSDRLRPTGNRPPSRDGSARSPATARCYALLILFGLNAVDELDRTAFAHPRRPRSATSSASASPGCSP